MDLQLSHPRDGTPAQGGAGASPSTSHARRSTHARSPRRVVRSRARDRPCGRRPPQLPRCAVPGPSPSPARSSRERVPEGRSGPHNVPPLSVRLLKFRLRRPQSPPRRAQSSVACPPAALRRSRPAYRAWPRARRSPRWRRRSARRAPEHRRPRLCSKPHERRAPHTRARRRPCRIQAQARCGP